MAAPSYATDLVDIYTDTSGGNFVLISSGGGGQNALTDPETDDYIQGSSAVSRNPWSSSIRGIMYEGGITLGTPAQNYVVYIWWKADVAQALDTKALGGIQNLIGLNGNNYDAFYVDGKDTYERGGWICTPINVGATPSTQVGSPGTGGRVAVGVRWNVPASGPSKGFPFKIDAIRRSVNGSGRIDITLGEAADPATWDKLVTWIEVITRRYGIVQPTNTGALIQGTIRWGLAGTAVYSRDSNRTIQVADNEFVDSDFTQIIIDNDSSDIIWTNLTFLAVGTNDRGILTILGTGTHQLNGCQFFDWNTVLINGNSTFDACTWRRSELITANGNITNSLISESTGAISVTTDDLAKVIGNKFESDGSNHAVELTALGSGTMSWENELAGYDSGGSGGSPVTPTSTGNEAIYVNFTSSSDLTINVADGATTPSIRVGAGFTGNVNVVAGQKTVTFTGLVAGGEFRIYDDDGDANPITLGTNREGVESLSGTTYVLTHPTSEDGNIIYAQYINPGNYEEQVLQATLSTVNQTINFNLNLETNV